MNFGLLNIPPHHPARDMWDTFYTTTPNVILRTHTSPGQIHVMRERCPEPIRVILPGHVLPLRADHRAQRDPVPPGRRPGRRPPHHDGRSEGHAHRVRARAVRPDRSARASARITSRSRSPRPKWTWSASSATAAAARCASSGGWLEILGCGMVHPTVLQNGGYDPPEFSGFAFGMGPQRITMLMHKIEDIRVVLRQRPAVPGAVLGHARNSPDLAARLRRHHRHARGAGLPPDLRRARGGGHRVRRPRARRTAHRGAAGRGPQRPAGEGPGLGPRRDRHRPDPRGDAPPERGPPDTAAGRRLRAARSRSS